MISNNEKQSLHIVIAAGGTGGHLFPGIAIAEAFQAQDVNNSILFIGTGKPLEKNILNHTSYEYQTISAEGIKGKGVFNKIRSMVKIPMGILEAMKIYRIFRPHIVIGVGGYVTGPAVIAAWLMRIPTALQEQNSIPGITNRILLKFVKRAYISFPGTFKEKNSNHILFTGNPVRQIFIDSLSQMNNVPEQKDQFTVMVAGGSQGAHGINIKVCEAFKRFHEQCKNVMFIHQTGTSDYEQMANFYQTHGIQVDVRPFIDDMFACYQKADVIICRAGATTIAEITALGKASILIPFPFAADNHQEKNANYLAEHSAAIMIRQDDLSPENLLNILVSLKNDKHTISNMQQAAKQLGKPDAAKEIVKDCYEFIQ